MASVNGSSSTGACGTAGTSGDFTVTSAGTTYTVDVGANSTTFKEKGVTAPSFAIVCTGDKVRTTGTISSDNIVTAIAVTVIPPRPQHVSGIVASVNGSSATGACGTAGTSGDFTVTSHATTYTVDVGANSTSFKEKGVTHAVLRHRLHGGQGQDHRGDLERRHRHGHRRDRDPAAPPARLGHRGLGERLELDRSVRDGGDLR